MLLTKREPLRIDIRRYVLCWGSHDVLVDIGGVFA
jgi:hypothetical protein